jgi:hypothetical protein
MTYEFTDIDGNAITVPPLTLIDYKGIKLIGRDTPNWNLPFQQNFVKLIDRIAVLEAQLGIS